MPDKFALGAAMGTPAARMRASAVLLSGIRTATVSRPPVTSSGTLLLFRYTMVSGPGQNSSISSLALSGTDFHRSFRSLFFAICSISGLSLGRPLASNILFTASPSRPLAPRP